MKYLQFLCLILLYSCSDNKTFPLQSSSDNKGNVDYKDRVVVTVALTNTSQQPISISGEKGLSEEILEAFNAIQNKFYFKHQLLPTKRLEEQGNQGVIDIAAFHNLNWGWKPDKVTKSRKMLKSKDVYIAIRKEGRTNDFFKKVNIKQKVGVLGFHYKFLQDESLNEVERSFTKTNSEKSVIEMILEERGDIGIVSNITLKYLKKTEPDKYEQLMISESIDSEYDRYYVIMQNSPINASELNSLINKLQESGQLVKIYKKFGLNFESQ